MGIDMPTAELGKFADDPGQMLWLSLNDAYALSNKEVAAVQSAALQSRFENLVDQVEVLNSFAQQQQISRIDTIEDAAFLLFLPTAYKSYPMRFIENNQFDRLARWLDHLTAHDLSAFDSRDLHSIDEWLDRLARDTPLRPVHTSGTTGKLSLLPRSSEDVPFMVRSLLHRYEWSGVMSGISVIDQPESFFVVHPGYRKSHYGTGVVMDGVVDHLFNGDESHVLTLNQGRMSADIVSLAGRLTIADSRGSLGRDQLAPSITARRDEILAEKALAPERADQFFARLGDMSETDQILTFGTYAQVYDVAVEGQKRGFENGVLGINVIALGGGMKGRQLPSDFRDVIKSFFRNATVVEEYSMSECVSPFLKCENGRHHIPPWVVAYVFDPDTGDPYPRTGTQTGRFGFFDLVPATYWGGFLTGDRVTISWEDSPCQCGRNGPHLGGGISRYSDMQGGDDKVSCAGAPEAFDRAIKFISDLI